MRSAALWLAYAAGGLLAAAFSSTAAASYVGLALVFVTLRRPRQLPFVLLLSPALTFPVGAFAWGAATYATGTACLWTFGRFSRMNPDPDVRCEWRSSGCSVSGREDLWQPPYNAGVQAMAWLFGPMPEAYAGPYPTEAEVRTLLSGLAGGKPRDALPAEWGVPNDLFLSPSCPECDLPEPRLRGLELDARGFLLAGEHVALLLDRKEGRVFAVYDLVDH